MNKFGILNQLIPEPGAERLWRLELQQKKRTRLTMDELWEAACYEARAREDAREGLIESANEDRRRAAVLLWKVLAVEAA